MRCKVPDKHIQKRRFTFLKFVLIFFRFSLLKWPYVCVHLALGHHVHFSSLRVKSLDPYQSKWLLLWAEAFCLRQPGLQGKQTHTDKSCNYLLFMHGLSKGTSVFSGSHFPFVYPHTLSPTPHELFSELKIDFHFWPSFTVPVVHLQLFGVSFSLCCSSALWHCFFIYAQKWNRLWPVSLYMPVFLLLSYSYFQCPEWQPLLAMRQS